MSKTEAEKQAEKRYREKNPDKVREWYRTYEKKRPPRDRAEYMREYRRRKKEESIQADDTATT
jgi:hypothetical protein